MCLCARACAQIPPWDNKWLVGAIATSMALHFGILYTGAAAMFGVTGLSSAEWVMVVKLSAPVIIVDEVMKAWSRRWGGAQGTCAAGQTAC